MNSSRWDRHTTGVAAATDGEMRAASRAARSSLNNWATVTVVLETDAGDGVAAAADDDDDDDDGVVRLGRSTRVSNRSDCAAGGVAARQSCNADSTPGHRHACELQAVQYEASDTTYVSVNK